jgi:hypothetical protein
MVRRKGLKRLLVACLTSAVGQRCEIVVGALMLAVARRAG